VQEDLMRSRRNS